VVLLTPVRDLPVRTHAAGAPPGEGHVARFDLGALAAERQLGFRSDAVISVDAEAREARMITGARIRYDALVVAFGARPRGAVPGTTTWWGSGDAGALAGLLEELRSGTGRRVAFAVGAGHRWTLPTYELALTASRSVRRAGLDEVSLTLVTYEQAPAELLGPDASDMVSRRLAEAGIELVTGRDPVSHQEGRLKLRPDGDLEVDRVLAMAAVDGPRIGGLPRDPDGFVPVDEFGRVEGAPGIWAAGEVTSFPVRQAGLAAQQARAVAASIAAEAGAEVAPDPFRPVVRGLLRSSAELATNAKLNGNGKPGSALLWWPPEHLDGEHLSAHIGGKLTVEAPRDEEGIPIEVELHPDGRRVAAGVK
jgi:sulfide:quinone oxidoreductase